MPFMSSRGRTAVAETSTVHVYPHHTASYPFCHLLSMSLLLTLSVAALLCRSAHYLNCNQKCKIPVNSRCDTQKSQKSPRERPNK